MNYEYYNYRFAEEVLNSNNRLKNEIFDIIRSIGTIKTGGSGLGTKLNADLETAFTKKGWSRQVPVAEGNKFKADFRKERIQVEVQFANASRQYIDLLKFQLSAQQGLIDVGIEILPKNALAKKITSNIANYEKMKNEIDMFKSVLTVPILVMGIDF